LEAYITHNEALRKADARYHKERDRRYAEVKSAEEKALKVKEEADKTALGLQRETQTYKDEKANLLREQINSERGIYATKTDLISATEKIEATIKPVLEYMSSQQGGIKGADKTLKYLVIVMTFVNTLIAIAISILL
jgi:vacuolar-type H+-ATPase subunit H